MKKDGAVGEFHRLLYKVLLFVGGAMAAATALASMQPNGWKIAAIPAKQDRPPLRITGVEGRAGRDHLSGVDVKNVSEKVIIKYRLGWTFRNAIRLSDRSEAGSEAYGTFMGNAIQTRLQPRGEETAPAQGVLPMDVRTMLREKGSTERVFILVGVVEVIFEDGTTWQSDPKNFVRVYTPQKT